VVVRTAERKTTGGHAPHADCWFVEFVKKYPAPM